MGLVVSDVLEPTVSNRSHGIVSFVHSITCGIHVASFAIEISAQKRSALHGIGYRDTTQVQHCRRKVEEAHQLIVH